MAVITDQQKKFYETTLQVTKQEISDLKDQIEEELAKVKDRIAELQNAINASKQMYAAACARLGLTNDLGLLAEEYDVKRQRQVGNFPQAFSHPTLIGAATAISAAEAAATGGAA